MTHLYLNQKEVFFDCSQSLKVTKENPMLTDSGSYTLNITLPMSIKQNVQVVGGIHRLDVSKKYMTFDALLTCDDRTIMNGTAVVTEITDDSVKVQLLSGNSEVRFWDKADKKYIDEIDYNTVDGEDIVEAWKKGRTFLLLGVDVYHKPWWEQHFRTWEGEKVVGTEEFVFMPVYDATNDLLKNMQYGMKYVYNDEKTQRVINRAQCVMPNLYYILYKVLEEMGYKLIEEDGVTYSKKIYIASARSSIKLADALPHWTVKELVQEYQKFFNCTLVFDDINRLVHTYNNSYIENDVELDVVEDDISSEVVSDEDVESSIASSNICYAERSCADIDIVDDEIINAFSHVKVDSISKLGTDTKTIYEVDGAQYVYDGSEYHQVNHFGTLIRNENNNDDKVELKIIPCKTKLESAVGQFERTEGVVNDQNLGSAFLYTQSGQATILEITNEYEAAENETAWDAIQNEEVDEGTDKEDNMEVFFVDENTIYMTGTKDDEKEWEPQHIKFLYPQPFTSRGLNMTDDAMACFSNWSMTFNITTFDKYIGKLHNTGIEQNRNVTTSVKFKSKNIPSVTSIFHVKGKKYRCQKLELTFTDVGMDELMKAYLVEIN